MMEFIGYLVVYITITFTIVISTAYLFTKIGVLPKTKWNLHHTEQSDQTLSKSRSKSSLITDALSSKGHKELTEEFLVHMHAFNYKRASRKMKYFEINELPQIEVARTKRLTELYEAKARSAAVPNMLLSVSVKNPAKKTKQASQSGILNIKQNPDPAKKILWGHSEAVH